MSSIADRAGASVARQLMQRGPLTRGHLPSGGSGLAGKTIALTGASSGIGAAAAKSFASQGATVILIARRADELAALTDEITAAGGKASYRAVDITDESATAELVEDLVANDVDVLINNAGRSIRRPILDSTDRLHDFHRTMAVNYFAAVQLTLGLLPHMRERGDGHIINVCTWALMPGTMPKFAAYGASKSALEIFSRSLGAETAGTGIATTTVYFPLVRTDMIAPTKKYNRRPTLSAAEAAEWLDFAVKKRPVRVTPNIVKGAPFLDAVAPRVLDRISKRGA